MEKREGDIKIDAARSLSFRLDVKAFPQGRSSTPIQAHSSCKSPSPFGISDTGCLPG